MFAPSFAAAQSDSLLYFQNDSLTEAGKGELRLHIENLNFFRNDEYASSISNGYTLSGSFTPTIFRSSTARAFAAFFVLYC